MRSFSVFLLCLLVHCLIGQSMAPARSAHPQAGFAISATTEWQDKWNNSLAYTLALLDKIPEEQLHFRPTADQMSIREQLQHMAGNMFSLSRRYLEKPLLADELASLEDLLRQDSLGKNDLTQLLKRAHAYASEAVAALDETARSEEVAFFAGPKTRQQIMWVLQDHATHHRAQLIVYARLLGIAPPRYTGW